MLSNQPKPTKKFMRTFAYINLGVSYYGM
jgi:hypothetical protein